MLHLARIWDVLVAHWMSQGVLLEPIGFILTCFKHQKFIQSGPGWHSEDTLKSNENRCVLIGLREGLVPFMYQNYILTPWLRSLGFGMLLEQLSLISIEN